MPVHAGKSSSTRTGTEDAFGGLLPARKRGIVSAFGNRRVGLELSNERLLSRLMFKLMALQL